MSSSRESISSRQGTGPDQSEEHQNFGDQGRYETHGQGQRVLRNELRFQQQLYHGHIEIDGVADHRDIAVRDEGQRDLFEVSKRPSQRHLAKELFSGNDAREASALSVA